MTTGVFTLGTETLAGEFIRATPTVEIDELGVTDDSTPTVEFTYTSPVSRAQVRYRYQVRSQDGATTLYDLTVTSSATTFDVNYSLLAGSIYRIYVMVQDGYDWSDWDYVTVVIDSEDPTDFDDNTDVGSVFEIAINGVGYMLGDNPELPVRRQTSTVETPRLATGQAPFNEAMDRYTFVGFSQFNGGAGQKQLDRADSDQSRFWDSFRIDPFHEDGLRLLRSHASFGSSTYDNVLLTVADSELVATTDDGEITTWESPADVTPTETALAGGLAVLDLVSDGTNWYACDGANIFRSSGVAWSTLNAVSMAWCIDRLAVVYTDGSDWCVSTLADDGTEEVAGGRFKYPDDSTEISDLIAGDGYLWFGVNRAGRSEIHFWQVGSDDTYAANALTLPLGERVVELGFYLGNVFVRTITDANQGGAFYRCIPTEGRLTAELVTDFTGPQSDGGQIVGFDRFVYFPWSETDFEAGTGCMDLATGGYAKWQVADGVTEDDSPLTSITVWNGKLVWANSVDGIWLEGDGFAPYGWLRTSITDQASSSSKWMDKIEVQIEPLPADTTVTLYRTYDGGNSYSLVGDTGLVANAGTKYSSWAETALMRSVGLEIEMTSGGVDTPELLLAQVMLHPAALVEQLVQLPVRIGDDIKGLNGQLIPRTVGISDGRARGWWDRAQLESLVAARVKYQDTDWPISQTSAIWEVADVRADLTGSFDRKVNRRHESGVAIITLRKLQ